MLMKKYVNLNTLSHSLNKKKNVQKKKEFFNIIENKKKYENKFQDKHRREITGAVLLFSYFFIHSLC